MKTQDEIDVVVGMPVWVYPANERCGGTIEGKVVSHVDTHSVHFMGERYRLYLDHHHGKLYSTKEAAFAARQKDKAEPKWMRKGKFHVGSGPTLRDYLSHKSEIKKENVDVHKTESFLYVTWVDKKTGIMQKHKTRCGAYYVLEESDLSDLVGLMRG